LLSVGRWANFAGHSLIVSQEDALSNLLSDFPVVVELPVVWGEMDAYGHVNNIIYFRYFECVRIAYFDRMEFMELKKDTGIGPILAEISCRYKIPLSYPDYVKVGARVPSIDSDRFEMEYKMVSKKHQSVAASGDSEIVCFNYLENKKVPLPDELIIKINEIEN
jgi:acyl-CoA thioester hydrolase